MDHSESIEAVVIVCTPTSDAQDERAVVDLSYIRNEVLQKVELLCYVTQMTTMLTVLSSTTGVTSHNSA